MKKAIKKIAAVAMAFTLLGTGTTIAKTVNPKSVTTLSVHAACRNHVVDSSATDDNCGTWQYVGKEEPTGFFNPDRGAFVYTYKKPIKCARCGKLLWYRYKKEYYKNFFVSKINNCETYEFKLYKKEYWTDKK